MVFLVLLYISWCRTAFGEATVVRPQKPLMIPQQDFSLIANKATFSEIPSIIG